MSFLRHIPFLPAAGSNFGGRGGEIISSIVIHTMQGHMAGTYSVFANPLSGVSAHYGIGRDGSIVQYVTDAHCAWHAGNLAVNRKSLGIELEGDCNDPQNFSDAMMGATAALCDDLCSAYGIPPDRGHIIGHNEVVDPKDPTKRGGAGHHTDPGPFFPWSRLIDAIELLRNARLA